jgi:hypothetical protein
MSDFTEIARNIGALIVKRKELEFLKWQLEQDILVRQLEITPEKWDGSNETERKISKEKTFTDDLKLSAIIKKVDKNTKSLLENSGELEALRR